MYHSSTPSPRVTKPSSRPPAYQPACPPPPPHIIQVHSPDAFHVTQPSLTRLPRNDHAPSRCITDSGYRPRQEISVRPWEERRAERESALRIHRRPWRRRLGEQPDYQPCVSACPSGFDSQRRLLPASVPTAPSLSAGPRGLDRLRVPGKTGLRSNGRRRRPTRGALGGPRWQLLRRLPRMPRQGARNQRPSCLRR